MKTDLLLQLAITFVTLSLLAVGGVTAILPELHRQTVDLHGWMDDATFAHLFAIAQVAPGPNMMVVSLIGLKVAGWHGLIVATLGFLLPAGFLAATASNLISRYQDTQTMSALKAGLVPVALGLYAAGGVVLCKVADQDGLGLALSAAATVFAVKLDRNPLWILAAAAVVGAMV